LENLGKAMPNLVLSLHISAKSVVSSLNLSQDMPWITINSCDLAHTDAFGHVFVLNGPGGSLCKYRLGAWCTRCTALCWEHPELSEQEMRNKMNN
jgi:hypothetical protein